MDRSVLIIGAGMSGLVAARDLASSGVRPILIDKSRAVGGRMASRRFGGGRFDHGAQHFSVRSDSFRRAVAEWRNEGLVHEWFTSPSDTRTDRAVEPRHVATGGMRNLPEALVQSHEVHLDTLITRLEIHDDGIAALECARAVAVADAAILTPPVPQMLQLLDAGAVLPDPEIRTTLEAISYDPCLAVMATLDEPSGLPDGHLSFGSGPIAWMADNQHKGASRIPAVTIHSSPSFAATHLEDDPAGWVEELTAAARDHLRGRPTGTRGHRWRYAMPRTTLETGCLPMASPVPLVLAGEVFSGARIEGAFLSGKAAAAAVLRMLGSATQ